MADFSILPRQIQRIAEIELLEVPSRVKEDILYIRNWISQQPHLNARTDDYTILMCLRRCKFSLEKTKKKIDLYYKLKSTFPELFANRDPYLPKLQYVFNQSMVAVLPHTESGPILIMVRTAYAQPDIISVDDILEIALLLIDVVLREYANSTVVGQSLLIDFKHISLKYATFFTPTFYKKGIMCFHTCSPVRIKGLYFLNLHTAFIPLVKLFKSLMPKKISDRTFFYSENDDWKLQQCFPKEVLPNEYGGSAGTFAELSDKLRVKVEGFREWLIEDAQYYSIEEKRPASCKLDEDFFSFDGSFRKLEVD